MTPDDLDRILRVPVTPLPIPEGRFDDIVGEARRRRRRSVITGLVSVAAVLALVVSGATYVLQRPDGPAQTVLADASQSSATTAGTPDSAPKREATPTPDASAAQTGPAAEPTAALTWRAYAPTLAKGGPVPTGFRPVSVSTASTDVVYALGTAPCKTKPCTSLVRSDTAGKAWIGVPAPKAELAGTDRPYQARTVRDVRFAGPVDGWAFGGGLYSTHDGARSWHRVDIGGAVLDLATDGNHVWAIVADCSDNACKNQRLLVSDTSGDHFRAVSGVTAKGAAGTGSAVNVVQDRVSVTFARAQGGTQAWVHPAGGRWQAVAASRPCPQSSDGVEGVAAVLPVHDGGGTSYVAFCGAGSGAGHTYFSTSASSDGGTTWTSRPSAVAAKPEVELTTGSVSFAAMGPSLLAAASGGNPDLGGHIVLSADGGRTWTRAPLKDPQAGWRYIGAAGGQRLLALPAVPDGTLWISSDAGKDWAAFPIR